MTEFFRKIIRIIPFAMFVIFPAHVLADEANTGGGLDIIHSDDYWFKLHGIIQIDATIFSGGHEDKQIDFPSGTNIRGLEANFEGGIGKDLSYNVVIAFDNGARVNDAFFTYSGFNNLNLSFGQVISPFCLENANSGKWIPFLERSLPVIAFRPCLGVGGRLQTWGENYVLILASTTPLHGTNKDKMVGGTPIRHRSDHLTTTGRFIYRFLRTDDSVFQVGASGTYGDTSSTFRDGSPNIDGRRFSTKPEANARNTRALVDSGNALLLKHYTLWGLEAGGLFGPLLVQAEYLQTHLNRDDRPNAQFNGWHAQAAYVLTGEMREYKPKDGAFGKVVPRCQYGAWEVAGRYSTVNLNDQDIQGGKENNATFALNWYVNKNLKIVGNYIYATIHPTQAPGAGVFLPNKRHLNIFAMRTQIVW